MNLLIPSAVNGTLRLNDFTTAARSAVTYLKEFMKKTPSEQQAEYRLRSQQHAANDIVLKLSNDIMSGNTRVTRVLRRAQLAKCLPAIIKIMFAGAPKTKVESCMSTAGDQLGEWAKGVITILQQRLRQKSVVHSQLLTSKDCDDVLRTLTGMLSNKYSEYSQYLRTVFSRIEYSGDNDNMNVTCTFIIHPLPRCNEQF
jgi:hypothetical protein